jgi:CRISPR-associated endoribonuclease Cas6
MPYALTLPLDSAGADALPQYPGRALHALFYQWLTLGDDALSAEVHERDGPRPFTVSPIYHVNGHPCLRLTLLDDALWPVLVRGIAKNPAIQVLGQTLTPSATGPQVTYLSYADLVANSQENKRILVRFLSPTSFRSQGMHYPLPDPRLVYQSWLTHWNAFAPQNLCINVALLDIVTVHVALGRYDLHTRLVDLGNNRKMVGFVGSVKFNVLRAPKIGREWLKRLNILADYAPFCGTGHKTTQGMGQTQRI